MAHSRTGFLKNVAQCVFLACIAFVTISISAAPKATGSITVQVVSVKTNIHRHRSDLVFSYTDTIFTQVNGKNVAYQCVQRGNICPLMDAGKTYLAEQNGKYIYFSMPLPDDKKTISVKYKDLGSW